MPRQKWWAAVAAAAVAMLGLSATTRAADQMAEACLDYIKTNPMMTQVPADTTSKYCGCLAGKVEPADRAAVAAVIKMQKSTESTGHAFSPDTLPAEQRKAGNAYFDALGACLPVLMGGAGAPPASGAAAPSKGSASAAPADRAPRSRLKTLAKASGWEAFGGTTGDGTPVCGVSLEVGDSWLQLKYFKGDEGFTVQVGDSSWTGKSGEKVKVRMRFDDGKPWSAEATAFKANKEVALSFEIGADDIDDWMGDFKGSDKLRIAFVDTDIPPWKASLAGARTVGEAMEDCIGKMARKRRL
ncbi:MAG TPA: hypothetical protein VGM96_14990 [Reyranella sp.]|jgi:hypothetical protein